MTQFNCVFWFLIGQQKTENKNVKIKTKLSLQQENCALQLIPVVLQASLHRTYFVYSR